MKTGVLAKINTVRFRLQFGEWMIGKIETYRAPACLLLGCLLLGGCIPIPISEGGYHDDKVRISDGGILYFPWPSMGPEWTVYKIYGHRYSKVRGHWPCYLEIPGKNTILFVTGAHGSAVVHLVDETSHKDRCFPAYNSFIGYSIGDSSNDRYEKVESVTGDTIIISAASSGFQKTRSKYHLNLSKPCFIREERDQLEWGSDEWKHHVLEAGTNSWKRGN